MPREHDDFKRCDLAPELAGRLEEILAGIEESPAQPPAFG